MNKQKLTSEVFDEEQSLMVIREMIQVSQKKIKNDGILMIVWGYAMSVMYFISYIKDILFIPVKTNHILGYISGFLPLLALLGTIYYVFLQHKKVRTYIGVSIRYIWVALFFSLVLINLIQNNVLHDINFMLQHPIFMTVISFATVVTGIILRYKLITVGGIIFAALALLCSYLALRDQMLFDAIAWFIAFVIPGHIMYHKRNS